MFGSVLSMIITLRNNSRERETIFENKPILEKVRDTTFPTQEMDPAELQAFREKLKKRKRRSDIMLAIFTVSFFALSLFFFLRQTQMI
ncbi:MAG TPA: hypothetical protein DCS93_11520 [Microscillaceae bacterium]|nr:hypothetical protein [Microscillaceae bacterium]